MSGKDELISIKDQISQVESWRKTDLTDISKVRKEVELIISMRKNLYIPCIEEYIKGNYQLYSNYRDIFNYTCIIPTSRQQELFPTDEDKKDPNYFKDKGKIFKFFGDLKKKYSLSCHDEIDDLVKCLLKHKIVKEDEFKNLIKKECTYTFTTFPKLVSLAITYEFDKINEFEQIFEMMLTNLSRVQKKEISQEECSNKILQEELSGRFFKK